MEQAYAELASTDSEGVMVFDDTPQPETFTAWIARRSRLEPDIAVKYLELRRMRRLAGALLVGMTLAFVIATFARSLAGVRLSARLCGKTDGGGLRGLVCGRGAVSPPVRPANFAHGARAAQQGAHRRGARPLHIEQFLEPRGARAPPRRHQFCGVSRTLALRLRECAKNCGTGEPFLPEAFDALPKEGMADAFARAVLSALYAVPASPVASQLLSLLWARGETQALLDHLIEHAELLLARNKDVLRAKVTQKSSRLIPKSVN